MKTVKDTCSLEPNALEINVGDQIEQLDEIIRETDGNHFFSKTYITDGMQNLISRGIARLAGKSNNSIFHLKQAMGGGKTHLMVGFGLLAKNKELRKKKIPEILYHDSFIEASVAAFNGRNNPETYLWGEIASQLGKESIFKKYWENGPKAPDESAWLELFESDKPILLLLDEMPPYFHYYSTQSLGMGTIADVITRAFSNMLTAAQKKKNICILVSDLEAAYSTGGKLIQNALSDASKELGRAEISITPVNLESNEIYEILRKRLFTEMPDKSEIQEIASVFASRLSEAARAKSVERSAESLASEIEETYPFHPRFKNIVALFKDNEKFKQTRGLMELVSRLLKSVWERKTNDVFLIGAQHFDLSIHEVREKLAEISEMRDVIARDLWDSSFSAHALVIDQNNNKDTATQVGCLLLTSSLSTAVNSIKGLTEPELLECLIDPLNPPSDYKNAFYELQKSAWYLHQTQEGRHYFDHQENLTKKLQGYADKAPQNKVDELIRHRLTEMFQPTTKEAYEKFLPLPEMDEAEASLKYNRTLLIISPDGKTPPEVIEKFYKNLQNKNNLLVLTGDKSLMASVEQAARHVYAVFKADNELNQSHPQRAELDEKKVQYQNDFQATILSVFDKVIFPGKQSGQDVLRSKPLDKNYSGEYKGEMQIIKTLTSDPVKLFLDVKEEYDGLKERSEQLLFGNIEEKRKIDLEDKLKQESQMPWIPPRALEIIIQEACHRGHWEDLGNGYISRKPKPKTTSVVIEEHGEPDEKGAIRLKVEPVNAGPTPTIHYSQNGEVTIDSPILSDNILVTKSLKVEFLAVDPTGNNLSGRSYIWKNKLSIRNFFDKITRKVELSVVPKGSIKYTLDGSEPRNGIDYIEPIQLEDAEVNIFVFAEAEGIEAKKTFTFPEKGQAKVKIKQDIPSSLIAPAPKKFDNITKTYDALQIARENNIEFEQVNLMVGSGSNIMSLTIGELKVNASVITEFLEKMKEMVGGDAPIVLTFKKAHFATGFELEQFCEKLGIEIKSGEVSQ